MALHFILIFCDNRCHPMCSSSCVSPSGYTRSMCSGCSMILWQCSCCMHPYWLFFTGDGHGAVFSLGKSQRIIPFRLHNPDDVRAQHFLIRFLLFENSLAVSVKMNILLFFPAFGF